MNQLQKDAWLQPWMDGAHEARPTILKRGWAVALSLNK